MNNKTTENLYYLFVILSILGLVEIASYQVTEYADFGIISLWIGMAVGKLFSSPEIAGAVMTIFNVIFNLALFWIILALMFKKKVNKSISQFSSICKKCGFQALGNENYCQKCGEKIPREELAFFGKHLGIKRVSTFLLLVIVFLVGIFIVKEIIQSAPLPSESPSEGVEQVVNDSQSKAKDWIEYDSVNGNFKILFPDWPSHDSGQATEEDPFDHYVYSTVLPSGTEYMAFVYKYIQEFDPTQEDATLEVFANGFKTTLVGELVESTYITFNGYRALDFLVYTRDDDSYFHGVAFLSDNNTVYSLAVFYKLENKSEVQFEKFSNSFTLK